MFWRRTPAQVAPLPQRTVALSTDVERRAQDSIVLEHVVGYIKRIADEGRFGLRASIERMTEIADALPAGSQARDRILTEVKMLHHLGDRLEYIDAHKGQSWDEMKYRNFINQFCPIREGGEDE